MILIGLVHADPWFGHEVLVFLEAVYLAICISSITQVMYWSSRLEMQCGNIQYMWQLLGRFYD